MPGFIKKSVGVIVNNGDGWLALELDLNPSIRKMDYCNFSNNLWNRPDVLNYIKIRSDENCEFLLRPAKFSTVCTFVEFMQKAVSRSKYDFTQLQVALKYLADTAFEKYIGKIPEKERYGADVRRKYFKDVVEYAV